MGDLGSLFWKKKTFFWNSFTEYYIVQYSFCHLVIISPILWRPYEISLNGFDLLGRLHSRGVAETIWTRNKRQKMRKLCLIFMLTGQLSVRCWWEMCSWSRVWWHWWSECWHWSTADHRRVSSHLTTCLSRLWFSFLGKLTITVIMIWRIWY